MQNNFLFLFSFFFFFFFLTVALMLIQFTRIDIFCHLLRIIANGSSVIRQLPRTLTSAPPAAASSLGFSQEQVWLSQAPLTGCGCNLTCASASQPASQPGRAEGDGLRLSTRKRPMSPWWTGCVPPRFSVWLRCAASCAQ